MDERKTLLRKIARQPNDDTSKRILEIEDQLCEANLKKNKSLYVKDQLNFAVNNNLTNETRSAWTIYRKVRPKKEPVIPVGKKNQLGTIVTNRMELNKNICVAPQRKTISPKPS